MIKYVIQSNRAWDKEKKPKQNQTDATSPINLYGNLCLQSISEAQSHLPDMGWTISPIKNYQITHNEPQIFISNLKICSG